MYRIVRIYREDRFLNGQLIKGAAVAHRILDYSDSPTELMCRYTTDRGIPNTFIGCGSNLWIAKIPRSGDEYWVTLNVMPVPTMMVSEARP